MSSSFDEYISRKATSSTKWTKFGPEVLPFWVADMDFAAPDFIIDALRARLDHPILGYTNRPDSLNDSFRGWLRHHFDWDVPPEWIVWVPGVVSQLNLAARTLPAGSDLIIPTPVYHPFLALAENAGLNDIRVPMRRDPRWAMDFDAMDASVSPASRMLLICNPQNPTGRCYDARELRATAEFIERHDLLLVCDEIHCNIVLDPDSTHRPIAAAHPEIAKRTITLYSPTKVYNIPGITCAAAVIPDARLRVQFMRARAGMVPGIGPLGFVAAEAAFNDRSDWVPQLLDYLRSNFARVNQVLGERVAALQGTYLAWLDVSDLEIDNAEAYFAEHGIGISPGAQFGAPGFIRFNFGCPRSTLDEGLNRLTAAIRSPGKS